MSAATVFAITGLAATACVAHGLWLLARSEVAHRLALASGPVADIDSGARLADRLHAASLRWVSVGCGVLAAALAAVFVGVA